MTDEIVRFQEEIRRVALAAARDIFKSELERNLAELKRTRASATKAAAAAPERTRGRRGAAQVASKPAGKAGAARAAAQLSLPLAADAAPKPDLARDAAGDAAGSAGATGAAPAAGAASNERQRWTRETIVNELANWILSGTEVDAAFVTRHGPRGLVAAARRVFGRFDAAMNVAAIHVSKLYPDGPPERRM